MAKFIEPVRGMNDILPDAMARWRRLEETTRELVESYGYREIRLPVVEKTELFKRSIGDATDIVEKEMYTFVDRSEESLTLRPEATAGMVRAGLSNGLLYNQVQKLWCAGPMFRHERPQKGRYRQFHQIDVEAFGLATPDIDAELMLMSARLWKRLGLTQVALQINSLGTPESRAAYREKLVAYFGPHRDRLDEDSRRRLGTNPLRILDSKVPETQALVQQAPNLVEHLDPESRGHFERLKQLLGDAGIPFSVNPRLVRGLDYYTRTVFEWTTTKLGAQDAICSGGRYDGLVAQLGGKPTPATGFAMGVERLVALMEAEGVQAAAEVPYIYMVRVGEAAERAGFQLAERLRDRSPGLKLTVDCGGGGFGNQLKRADKSGAAFALLLGENEVAGQRVTLKNLRDGSQEEVSWDALPDRLT
ncbi:MAG TPA: histidine--tRNA ligase [Gammaproteobacteria bacterium]|nr:histidine--tRNA ligase [Gammaproteobacteria bacterium]